MPNRTHQRPNKANAEANALASWDNEGGAAKGAPQKDRDDLTFLDKKEERILRCLGAAASCNGMTSQRIFNTNSLSTPCPWAACITRLT